MVVVWTTLAEELLVSSSLLLSQQVAQLEWAKASNFRFQWMGYKVTVTKKRMETDKRDKVSATCQDGGMWDGGQRGLEVGVALHHAFLSNAIDECT